MIIIVEGQDRTGKDTLIKRLTTRYFELSPIVIHCIGTKLKEQKGKEISYRYYDSLLSLITKNDNMFILNRSHLGESVYSPLYRNYSGDYVFDLEEKYDFGSLPIFLITIVDSSHKRLDREDNQSLSSSQEFAEKEKNSFILVHGKSLIENKKFIDIVDKDEIHVYEESVKFLNKFN